LGGAGNKKGGGACGNVLQLRKKIFLAARSAIKLWRMHKHVQNSFISRKIIL
jgi:hypothetical protein